VYILTYEDNWYIFKITITPVGATGQHSYYTVNPYVGTYCAIVAAPELAIEESTVLF